MLVVAAVLLAVAGQSAAAPDTIPLRAVDSTPLVVVDTPVTRRRHAIQYSDAYYLRLTVHRIGSYTMLPLFAAEYALGQNLINDASPASWIRPSHTLVASGIGVLFGVNTITGAWNFWDSRQDPAGRTRRIVHSALMLASDAGFLATAAVAPGRRQFDSFADHQQQQRVHRNVAIGSISVATIGGVMMWFWKE
jgi:hypothetical protein